MVEEVLVFRSNFRNKDFDGINILSSPEFENHIFSCYRVPIKPLFSQSVFQCKNFLYKFPRELNETFKAFCCKCSEDYQEYFVRKKWLRKMLPVGNQLLVCTYVCVCVPVIASLKKKSQQRL